MPKPKRRDKFEVPEIDAIIGTLNGIVEKVPDSTLAGLTLLATCTAGMLDIYAQPNDNNPEGMADDPMDLRKWFVDQLMQTPLLEKKK